MKLLEYEAKVLLRTHHLPVPLGQVLDGPKPPTNISWPVVLKAQVPVGGRGKAGGIKVAQTAAEFEANVAGLLSRPLLGHKVSSLLVEERLDIQRELYLAMVVDRAASALVLLAHPAGGMEVETASLHHGPALRLPLVASPDTNQTQQVAEHLQLPVELLPQLAQILDALWQTARAEDAVLVEVNPLVLTRSHQLVCADAKIELDDAAYFRHPDWSFVDKPQPAQFVPLARSGTIASVANGAGLAMATIDAIKAAGAEPANFCDVGGGTNESGLVQAFECITALPSVQAIVVNIFGGITRCDEVARAIITARRTCIGLPPLFIRLVGTNAETAHQLLAEADLPLLPTLDACVSQAVARLAPVSQLAPKEPGRG